MGQHRPISKVHADGIVRVGSGTARKLAEQPLSDWFLRAAGGSGDAFAKLRLYAQVCRHHLGESSVPHSPGTAREPQTAVSINAGSYLYCGTVKKDFRINDWIHGWVDEGMNGEME